MAKRKKERLREERIDNEVVVDAYGPEERAMGWYYYLERKIRFTLGAGYNGNGTLVANYTGTAQARGPKSVTLAGSATIGGANRWDIRATGAALISPTNAYTLTKHAGELLGRLYQSKYGMEVATVRWLCIIARSGGALPCATTL